MLLLAVLSANYGQIEAEFYQEDLLSCTLRRAINLTESWLLSRVSEEQWERDYKHVLSTDLEETERLKEQMELWAPDDETGIGSFTLTRLDDGKEAPPANFNFKSA